MENKEKNKITVRCQECNNEFEAQRTSAKFCSAKCRVKFNSRGETPKEAQIKPEIEKVVESTQIPIEACTMHDKKHEGDSIVGFDVTKPLVYEKQNETVILASIVDSGFGHIARIEKKPISAPNQTFDQLLKRFHDLIESNPKPSDIKLKLEQIKESAKLSNLTPRQTDAIVDRCNFYAKGQYKLNQLS